ncbi:hypothetical protein CDD82_4157 [Ophiocordyceps australis]|uniref:non-specific serine/threonine protein kinase n=1 Tax=Ophiocordyceps australis TaxID=1399860 RepID=A0A2C5XL98_9HYPO|nr:hypothetical protein CDD82_4157 [Ophiocordyceps australis]
MHDRQDANYLKVEADTYELLKGVHGVPRVLWFGVQDDYHVMVHNLLGASLEDLFNYCDRRFSLKTVLLLAEQGITRLQHIHSKGILHRDIKPDNFLIGTGREGNVLYIIDFGLAVKHAAAPKKGGTTLGTRRYASLAAHKGEEQTYGSDLEALGYVLMYFLLGKLPWQTLSTNKNQPSNQAGKMKLGTALDKLCEDLPGEFATYFEYTRGLKFGHKPNYTYVRGLFRKLFRAKGYTFDNVFDWTEKIFREIYGPETKMKKQPRVSRKVAKPAKSGGDGDGDGGGSDSDSDSSGSDSDSGSSDSNSGSSDSNSGSSDGDGSGGDGDGNGGSDSDSDSDDGDGSDKSSSTDVPIPAGKKRRATAKEAAKKTKPAAGAAAKKQAPASRKRKAQQDESDNDDGDGSDKSSSIDVPIPAGKKRGATAKKPATKKGVAGKMALVANPAVQRPTKKTKTAAAAQTKAAARPATGKRKAAAANLSESEESDSDADDSDDDSDDNGGDKSAAKGRATGRRAAAKKPAAKKPAAARPTKKAKTAAAAAAKPRAAAKAVKAANKGPAP